MTEQEIDICRRILHNKNCASISCDDCPFHIYSTYSESNESSDCMLNYGRDSHNPDFYINPELQISKSAFQGISQFIINNKILTKAELFLELL